MEVLFKKLDKKELEKLFREYFSPLCAYARKFISDIDTSKEIVHDVFINLWDKRDSIDLSKSVKSYLYTSVHNRCLNHIRDNKKFDRENIEIEKINNNYNWEDNDHLVEAELAKKINDSINLLPEKCKEIFLLSRFEQLKYTEISEKLNISIKTVEAQMSKALKVLRKELSDVIVLIILFLMLVIK